MGTMTETVPEDHVAEVDALGPAFYPDLRSRRPIYLSGVRCGALEDLEASGSDVGLMLQPRSHLEEAVLAYRLWAADNGCFAQGESFEADAWWRWVCSLPDSPTRFGCRGSAYESRLMVRGVDTVAPFGCLFVVAPDVVGDARATWERSAPWLAKVRKAGYPVALVAQDGAEEHAAMWDEIDAWDALFIGGTDDWKLSSWARAVAHEAHLSAKWVHVGRVNSWRRLSRLAAWDVDSVDGTYLRFGPTVNGRTLHQWLDRLATPSLF